MQNNVKDIIWFLGFVSLIWLCLLLVGCNMPEVKPLVPTIPQQTLINTIVKTDWIITVSILGVALSVIAWMNGSKTAIGVMAGCGIAIWMQLTVVRYAHILAWMGLVFAVGIILWTVFVKNRALREIVNGVQNYRKYNEPVDSIGLKVWLREQNKTTKKIVSKIKGEKPGKKV